jgi:hypothetical protein
MGVFNGVFPVLPGQEDALRVFGKEIAGPRLADFTAQQARADVTEESWTLQQTPMGSFCLVYFKGDVEKAFADIGSSESEFATWFRTQVLAISGVDLAKPDEGPPPEMVLDWQA